MVRKELEEIARTHPDQFDLWYTLDRPPIGTISSALTHHGSAPTLDHFEDWSLSLCFGFVGPDVGVKPWALAPDGKCEKLRERGFGMACF